MANAKTFHWVDYLIFILTLAISAGIGIFYAWKDKRKQNTTDFLLGGRKMSILPVTLSLMASFLSAVLVLGVPTEIYYNGTMYWLISFSNIITFPVAVHAFLPVFHNLQLSSAYEYLELRFNKVIRIMGVIVFQMQMILYMAVVLYAPALALNQVMGFSLIVSILVIGLVCTFYTAIGGLKAVMWTDAFQMVIVFVGLVALVIKATMEVGGFEYVWDTAKEAGKLQADNFDTNPFERHTFWTLVIGGFVTSMTIYGGNQAMIQRYLSMENVRSAQAALYWNLPASIVFTTLLVYTGLVLFAKYGNADPVGCGNIERRDQMIPWLVMDVLGDYHGFPGLVVACLFSASLSTVSSGVNALALVFLTDILKPLYRKVTTHDLNEARATIYSKILALVYGFLTIGLGFLAEKMGSLILQIALSIFGMVGGPLLSLFVMAMFFPCINSWGAGIGLVASITFSFWLAIGSIVNRRPLPFPECTENDTFAAITSIAAFSDYTTGFDTSQLDDITSTLPSFSTVAINASHLTNTSILDDVTTAFSSVLDTTTRAIQNEGAESSGLDQFYKLSYLWYSSTAVIVGVTVALFVSCATGGTRKKPVDSKLLSPLYLYLKSFAKTKKTVAEEDVELNSNQNTRNGDCQLVSPLNVTVKVSSREHAFKEE